MKVLPRTTPANKVDLLKRWSIQESLETYGIPYWGRGYFSINPQGHLVVNPSQDPQRGIDLKELVDDLLRRGIDTPILIRFSDILKSRVDLLNQCFAQAIQEYGYQGQYRGVYPIKVNQERQVVEEVLRFGRSYHYGLEAGSKPELLAVLALLEDPEALIILNGYKDDEFVETALLASKCGKRVIVVVEKFSELELIRRHARALGIAPRIGVRAKLVARGTGRWEGSGGDKSKFGLTVCELLRAIEFLRQHQMLDCLQLLHFHLGSQVTSIRNIKAALSEACRLYVELFKLGANLQYFDVGGGLGVDYDGSRSNFIASINYDEQEYANDVVDAIKEACDAENVPHPIIVSESGRAVAAHHAVLILEVLGVSETSANDVPEKLPPEAPDPVRELFATWSKVKRKNFQETFHDAVQIRDEALQMFNLGYLSLHWRVVAENLFWATCNKILRIVHELDYVPDDLEGLERSLADTYFCNFSLFQSAPDAWAISQPFPTVPIHRLDERPTKRGILADITCDSDGKMDKFPDLRDVKHCLELHPLSREPYRLAIFLLGAYQEILGDLHNLFGDTNAVHVSLDAASNGYRVEHVVEGDTVTEVLAYVNFTKTDLVHRMRMSVESALRAGSITLEESRHLLKLYDAGLEGYTYLEGGTGNEPVR